MASAASALVQTLSLHQARDEQHSPHGKSCPLPTPLRATRPVGLPGRRQLAFLLTASTTLTVAPRPSAAQDIPLFGLRKKLRKVEEEAEEIVREGFEAAEKGIEAAEKGIVAAEKGVVAAEKGVETAEREIEAAVSFGGLAQAGAVAAAEVVGVLVATSVVNGILGPERQRS
ncbi:Thioredoxin domain-containing protein [Psidium guajava]|nr:Thioredoxin domain-containing protein [Psidium guajava]